MEKNDNMILSDKTVGKEYQIPELVDLNSVNEAMGTGPTCLSGTNPSGNCLGGGHVVG